MGRSEPIQERRITVIKRVAVLYQSELRRRMESDHLFRSSNLGFREATRFLQEVTTFGLTGVPSGYQPQGTGLRNYFDPSSEEGQWVIGWFSNAVRVQVVILLEVRDSIKVELMFFLQGEKQSFRCAEFTFSKEGRAVGIHIKNC